MVEGYEPSTPRNPPPRAPVEKPAPKPEPPKEEKVAVDRGASLPERLTLASPAQLRTRRERIDKRLIEIATPIGEAALAIGGPIYGTRVVDIDRIVKKIDRVDNDIADAEKLTEPRPEGFLKAIGQDLARLSERFAARELHQKRARLVSELGLAVLAADLAVLKQKQPEVGALLEKHAEDARAVDDLFRQARLVDEELDARAKDGRLHKEPKAIDKLIAKTGEVVGDASDAAKEKIVDLGKTAAKTAVKQSGKAVWGIAKGAFKMGQRKLTGDSDSDDDDEASDADDASDERPRRASKRDRDEESEAKEDVPELLRKLARLHKDGVLTDEEFAKKKAELLK